MDKTPLATALDDLRPRIPGTLAYALESLLGGETMVHAQAQWTDPGNERGLEIDVFTSKHRFNAALATGMRPFTISVTPLVFAEVRNDDDECAVVIGDKTVQLFASSSRRIDSNGPARAATGDPEKFLRWAIENGTWA